MKWFYSIIVILIALFYTSCAAIGSLPDVNISVAWGVLLIGAGLGLLTYLLSRPKP